ncbi:hypothetical protein [Thermococcus sp.]|nr:hypothetical protein [Thermococcus sp.]
MGMKNKVLIGLLATFILIVIIGLGPWWKDISGGITPSGPNVTATYLGIHKPQNIGDWQFVVKDPILTDCMVAYLYEYDGTGKLTVYEIDAGTLEALGLKNRRSNCTNVLRYGVFAVNFTGMPEALSIEIWVSKSSTGGHDVYFQQLGDWRFVNGSYIGYIAPPMNNDYALMNITTVEELVNKTGIHMIKR